MEDTNFFDSMTLLSVAILVGCASLGSALGVSNVGAQLLESVARQPAETDNLQNRAFLMSGMLDAIPILAVALGLLLLFSNPVG